MKTEIGSVETGAPTEVINKEVTELISKSHAKLAEMTAEKEKILSNIEKMQHDKLDHISSDVLTEQ